MVHGVQGCALRGRTALVVMGTSERFQVRSNKRLLTGMFGQRCTGRAAYIEVERGQGSMSSAAAPNTHPTPSHPFEAQWVT